MTRPRPSTVVLCAALAVVTGLAVLSNYIGRQGGRLHFGNEGISLTLHKGGYRAWHLYWAAGLMNIDGRWVPCTVSPDGTLRAGRHWPRFRHTDLRWLRTNSANVIELDPLEAPWP